MTSFHIRLSALRERSKYDLRYSQYCCGWFQTENKLTAQGLRSVGNGLRLILLDLGQSGSVSRRQKGSRLQRVLRLYDWGTHSSAASCSRRFTWSLASFTAFLDAIRALSASLSACSAR